MKIDRKILLNPGPASTSDLVKYAQLVPDICPREKEFGELLSSICDDLVKLAKGDDKYDAILFGGSGTAAVEAVLSSCIGTKDKLLIIQNGAYGRRMVEIARIYGLPFDVYELEDCEYPDTALVSSMLKTGAYSHLAMVHHETTTGMLNPLSSIASLCRESKTKLIVDAMSSFGGIEIDAVEENIHAIIASSNKCIHGMAGLSFVVFHKSILENSSEVGRTLYLDLNKQVEFFKKNKQLRFTPPVQVAYAFRKALNLCLEERVENRSKRYRKRMKQLREGLRRLGFEFLLPSEWESGILVSVLEPDDPSFSFSKMHDYLFERGITIYPGKTSSRNCFRLAVMGELTSSDIDLFLMHLEAFLINSNIRMKKNG